MDGWQVLEEKSGTDNLKMTTMGFKIIITLQINQSADKNYYYLFILKYLDGYPTCEIYLWTPRDLFELWSFVHQLLTM